MIELTADIGVSFRADGDNWYLEELSPNADEGVEDGDEEANDAISRADGMRSKKEIKADSKEKAKASDNGKNTGQGVALLDEIIVSLVLTFCL